MRKYRKKLQPEDSQFRMPRNPIPWTTKFLIGIVICLAGTLLAMLAFRKDTVPFIRSLVSELVEGETEEEASLPPAVFPSPAPTPTFPPGSAWLAAITVTTIYSAPGEETIQLGILEGGDRARIVGKDPGGEWWAIRVPYVEGGVGWVNDSDVQSYDTDGVTELIEIQSSSASEAEATPAEDSPKLRAIANTNIRSGPGLEFVKIGLLKDGQQAEILGKDPEAYWWMIKVNSVEGERGWVSRDYVIAQNADDVPIVGTSSIQFGAIPTPAAGEPALSSAQVINIRAGPGTNFAIIGKLAPDQKAVIVGVSADRTWWAIRIPSAQNQRGWVSSQYVDVSDTDGVPVIQ